MKETAGWNVYLLFWCLHRIYEAHGAGNHDMGSSILEQTAIIGLCLLTAVNQSVRCMCLAILVTIVADGSKLPFVWDSELWCNQTDTAILLAVGTVCGSKLVSFWRDDSVPSASERALIYEAAADIIRYQMMIFYSAAAFWKLNTDFLNPHGSCAPIFLLQLTDFLWPSGLALPDPMVTALALTSPSVTILLETAVVWGLWFRPRVGVALALLLHLGIALNPPPNNVATFSFMCVTRLLAFMPLGAARAVTQAVWTRTGVAATVAITAVAAHWGNHATFFDVALPIFMGVFPLLCDAVRLQPPAVQSFVVSDQNKRLQHPTAYVYGRRFLVALALVYAFLLIPLGVQDQGQPHMYANLRLHAGSNHFVAPTALLQTYFEKDPSSSFGGGIIRIESTDAATFNEIYPGEYTLPPRTKAWLETTGHAGRMFNPMLTAVTSSEAPWDPTSPFVKYTFPAHEFRRLLAVARANQETFYIEYTQLWGHGNETWRATGSGRRVQLAESPAGIRHCRVLSPEAGPCTPHDVPYLPPLAWWAQKFLLFEPYPILPGDYTALQCFGP
jgi:hypothetical protein